MDQLVTEVSDSGEAGRARLGLAECPNDGHSAGPEELDLAEKPEDEVAAGPEELGLAVDPDDGSAGAREEAVSRGAEERETAVGEGQPADRRSGRADTATGAVCAGSVDPLRELYEEGVWRDQRQWRCRLCPFDTLKGEEVIRAHAAKQHVLGLRDNKSEGGEEKPQILVARR